MSFFNSLHKVINLITSLCKWQKEASKLNWQKVLDDDKCTSLSRPSFYVFCLVHEATQLKIEMQHKKNCTKSLLAFQLQPCKLDTAFHRIS